MAAESWVLSSIEARGYGGIGASSLRIDLDRPVVVLLGPNGSGKSTWVSAIEWALFGEIDFGNDFSIEELGGRRADAHRVYIHRDCDETEVILRFHQGGATLVWRRLRRHDRPQPEHDEITCEIDGTPAVPDPSAVFGVTPELFVRALAPRQTNMLGLVSVEDQARNGAIDRLFGMEQLNWLAKGLSDARRDISKKVGDLQERFELLAGRQRDEVRRRFDARAEARRRALEANVLPGELTLEGARSLIREVSTVLSMDLPEKMDDVSSLKKAHHSFEGEADRHWAEPGPQERLNRLDRLKTTLEAPRNRWQEAIASYKRTVTSLEALRASAGNSEDLQRIVAEGQEKLDDINHQLSAASKRAAVLVEARGWLQESELPPGDDLRCPVCDRPILAQELGQLVNSAIESLKDEDDGEITRLDAERQAAENELKEAQARSGQLEQAIENLSTVNEEASAKRKELVSGVKMALDVWAAETAEEVEQRVMAQCEKALSVGQQPRRHGDEGDLDDETLDAAVREVLTLGAEALGRTQQEVASAIAEAQGIRTRIIAFGRLIFFLEAAEELDALDQDLAGDELTSARSSLQQSQEWRETLGLLTEAAASVSMAAAEQRVAIVSPKLNEWFSRISQHDLLKGARVEVETSRAGGTIKNAYRIRAVDPNGSWAAAPGPMLSGGYQTALTVAALCALADDEARRHQLGLLVLDEPTQSLDPDMSRRMGEVLGASAPVPITIITTTDDAFAAAVQKGAGAGRSKVLRLKPWTAAEGTQFEGEDV